MYKKLSQSEKDSSIKEALLSNETYQDSRHAGSNYRCLAAMLVMIIALMFVMIVTVTLKERTHEQKGDQHDQAGEHHGKSNKHYHHPPHKNAKKPRRVILDEQYLKITDCGETSKPFNIEYFSLDPLPTNLYTNTTINTRFVMREGLHWSSELELELNKWLFGQSWLSMPIPCFMDYFGSCRFNFCDMVRTHWDEQFCSYIRDNYDMSCQCPYILGPGVFTLDNMYYKPKVDRVLKYFSLLAEGILEGWYDMKVKLYKKRSSTKPYLCVHVHFYLDTKEPKDKA